MLYQKIPGPYKRDMTTNKVVPGQWNSDAVRALADVPIWQVTEKVDGCLEANTRVVRADGSSAKIREIQKGDYVLGYRGEKVVPAKVERASMKSRAGDWVTVRTSREGVGRGNHTGRVTCTDDHRFWTPDRGYVEAGSLREGDVVLSVRSDLSLTPLQTDVLTGKMLGDGSLSYRDNSRTASVEFGHVSPSLVNWTLRGLGELAGNRGSRTSGYGSKIITGRSQQGRSTYDTFRHWIREDTEKQVPDDLNLTPISLAFWYMDDGSLSHHDGQEDRATFATNGFNRNSVEILLRELHKLGVGGVIQENKGLTIRLNSDDAERLFLLITPYLPGELQYKLPERYRGFDAWLPPDAHAGYKPLSVAQRVVSVTQESEKYLRYDLQTETENFFTTGGLVHNSNIRVLWDGYRVSFGGRTERAELHKDLVATLTEMFPEERFEQTFGETPVVLFGEGYGAGIQKGGMYRQDKSFAMFDAAVNGKYLRPSDTLDLASQWGIEHAPLIGTEWTLDEVMDVVRAGYESRYGNFIAEGLVAKTGLGLLDHRGNRIVVKVKGVDFA